MNGAGGYDPMPRSARPLERNRARASRAGATVPARPGSALHPEDLVSRRTEMVLRELDVLPTLPSVAARLLQLGADEEADVKEIVRLIETDPTLTARLLSLCKRAATRTRYPITTVEMAVVMLGLEAVRSLVLSVQIFDWSNQAPRRGVKGGKGDAPTAGFNRIGFWQHSIAVACCADLMCREHPELELHGEEAFVCGLVHDLGKLALDLVLPRAYARVIELAEQREGNIADFERPIVGLDHHAAGAKLAERWGLPGIFRDVMLLHGLPFDAIPGTEHRTMVALVTLSDSICRKMNLGWSGNLSVGIDDRGLCERAGFNYARVEKMIPRLYEATSARCRDLGLGDEPSQQLLVESILRANARLGRLNQELGDANRQLQAAQAQLTETRALTRLGEMTAGAAHELNNPLTVISARAQALSQRVREDRDRAAAETIVEACQRLTGLIARLNRIATPPNPSPEPQDLRPLLEEVIKRAKARAAEHDHTATERSAKAAAMIGVKLTIAEGQEPARVDRDLLTDALIEVVVNAIESNPRGPVEVRVQTDPDDDRLVIQIVDDGSGMSEHTLNHALDPFFSQKPAGRQTGLGLALAHRLVQAQGGTLELSSKPGRGTTVSIGFPIWRCGRD
ncbi:MAG: HDOD domain-containing protein [Phycisphaerales bacterium]|nr:HDOD domain-containing protein [Phycisphaerales bacterium]